MERESFGSRFEAAEVPEGSAAIWWLAGAGFALKSRGGTRIYIDPYLSDAVERAHSGGGFENAFIPAGALPGGRAPTIAADPGVPREHCGILRETVR